MLLKKLLRYRGSSACNQLLIARMMSKIIFVKYLPIARPQIGPKIKNAQNLLKFHLIDISNMSIFDFNVKNNFYLIFTNC